jgi:acetylornithine deacetylase/succinyl-diaminopimelate desuccinylase-like protein
MTLADDRDGAQRYQSSESAEARPSEATLAEQGHNVGMTERAIQDPAWPPLAAAEDEVVDLCRALIQIDTTNAGDETGPGEAEAAEYVESLLAEVGYQPERFETTSGRRQGVIVRIPGSDPHGGTLLVHGHLDVVPARASDWQSPPFAAEVVDDMIWGRGAVDMKDMDAMILATARDWALTGAKPRRDIVLMFLPDEEAGGHNGSHWLIDNRPDLFEGVTEAVGEVGGFSLTVRDDLRLYLIQTAEKGMGWLRLRAAGRAGHGSMLNDENAITALSAAVAQIGAHKFPVHVTDTVRAMLEGISSATGIELDPNDMETTLARLGPLARLVGATLMNTANPTMFSAGYKVNVVPGEATAAIDGRFLPGHEAELFETLDEIIGDRITREFIAHDVALETTFDGPTIDAMAAALGAEDPGAIAIPYMLSGGTDAKAFSRLGIRGYGFAPLLLPPDLDFGAMFHGVDERVPVSALKFGVRVLDRFLRTC